MSLYFKTTLQVFSNEYECHVIEQENRAKGTRYKAYGNFEGKSISAQGPSPEAALKRLEQRARIHLDS